MYGTGTDVLSPLVLQLLIVTLGKSETYKETMKEKSTILPYSIHKRIHVRPLRNLIQGILQLLVPYRSADFVRFL